MALGLGGAVEVIPQPRYVGGTGELDYIYVTVKYKFTPVTPLLGKFFGEDGSIVLTSNARQLMEVPMACQE